MRYQKIEKITLALVTTKNLRKSLLGTHHSILNIPTSKEGPPQAKFNMNDDDDTWSLRNIY